MAQEKDSLIYERKLVWDSISEKEKKTVFEFAEGYRRFISEVKTERETCGWAARIAAQAGFSEFSKGAGKAKKIFCRNKFSGMGLVRIGRRPFREGFRLIVSHGDTPRLDLKPQPLVEEDLLGFLKTHYYGGIKKYQWVTRPLSLHGVIVLKNGTRHDVVVGEKNNEPVFTVTDLLPHLAKDQMEKKMSEGVQAESLNLLVGALPEPKKAGGKEPEKPAGNRVKKAILRILNGKYGLTEEDLVSADLQAVPAGPAQDLGFDRALILGYGQDDRICTYTSMQAFLEAENPEFTTVCLIVDREEIGSEGVSSIQSNFLSSLLARVFQADQAELNEAFSRSYAISADVNGGLDPAYREVFEPQNAPRLGCGTVLTKFTGHGGKYGSSEASAEFVARLRSLFSRKKVFWQTGELGRIDKGGGGTVAKYLTRYQMETIDIGPALLSMHAPCEVSHKADIYSTYQAYLAFYLD